MRYPLITLTFFLPILCSINNCFGQDLVLSGKIYSRGLEITANRKIFYAEVGNKFNPNQFILYDENYNYKFAISVAKIKKEYISAIVFALDSSQNSKDEYACVHRINVGAIVKLQQFASAKSIKLKSDLDLDLVCSGSGYYDAKMDSNSRFVGEYKWAVNDTIHKVQLNNEMYQYNATLSKETSELINAESGSWEFDKSKKILQFYVKRLLNEKLGLVIRRRDIYEFELSDQSGVLIFKNISSSLVKL